MTRPTGVLAIWHDIAPAHERDVLRWYNREHHPERVTVPGFLRARRYVATHGSPEYFIYYEVSEPRVLASEAYLARVNAPTPWTRSSMVHFRRNVRTACYIAHRQPGAAGAHVATTRLSPRPGAETELRSALVDELFPALSGNHPLFLRAELWTADRATTAVTSNERALRDGPDAVVDWVVVAHASCGEQLDAMVNTELSSDRLTSAGAATEIATGTYQLQLALEQEEP